MALKYVPRLDFLQNEFTQCVSSFCRLSVEQMARKEVLSYITAQVIIAHAKELLSSAILFILCVHNSIQAGACMVAFVCMCAHTGVCICACSRMHDRCSRECACLSVICPCTYMRKLANTCRRTYANVRVPIRACLQTCFYMCVCLCAHVCTCICMCVSEREGEKNGEIDIERTLSLWLVKCDI